MNPLDKLKQDLQVPEGRPAAASARLRIGRFELVREIARGGMGVVFEAIDPQLRRRVALKVVSETNQSPVLIERLRREASAAARVKHPNIVSIHEVGSAPDESGRLVHFIAMDYIDGE